ncbi:TetR/AcrR family transcriptional regulator [Paraglaciecola aquimarina]|uniref:TetR/AcrR family transcriptional regulator n=1 Tax=Paraglaciecola aquimarina TaxID=1235557 RepID=A0ABU3SUP2_9ALTE|nr:TetR/AcrR family transcriptional regulator [Paraglaciecola aquimarina]MDU0353708.1 TetR/AcrR family transcriptional regulator [Paraglaciecola aquimarina]
MQPRKQHLVDTALVLFNQHGYHATGIDLILAQAKVSKATLYKHFRSKDELILAALEQRHEQVLHMINAKIEAANRVGDCGVLAIFDALNEWFNSSQFFGCNFINACAEFTSALDPIHIFSAQHKQAIVALIQSQLADKGKHQAEQIGLLVEGAIVLAHTRGMKDSAIMAKGMASSFIDKNHSE